MSNEHPTNMSDLLKQLSTHNRQLATRLIFPDSKFHEAIDALLCPPSEKGSKAWPPSPKEAPALIKILESREMVAEIEQQASRWELTLILRWQGMQNLALFLLTGQGDKLLRAIRAFDILGQLDFGSVQSEKQLRDAIEAFDKVGPSRKWPRPAGTDRVGKKFIEATKINGGSDLFKDELWSAGTYLVYDLFSSLCHPKREQLGDQEQTPILVVNDIPNQRSATALWLTVERRRGGAGLIQPDWWSLGLLALGGTGEENFRGAIETAMLAAAPKDGYRYYWRLSHHTGIRPEAISGRSAQASAACCVLALNEHSQDNPGPLLDETAAISACVAPAANVELEQIELEQVDPDTFENKMEAAARAGLHGLLFCQGQRPDKETVYEYVATIKGQKQEPHRVFLLGVSTLVDGYDNLLLSSKAMRAYKQEIVIDWKGGEDERGDPLRDKEGKIRGRWIEEETHEDFKNASRETR